MLYVIVACYCENAEVFVSFISAFSYFMGKSGKDTGVFTILDEDIGREISSTCESLGAVSSPPVRLMFLTHKKRMLLSWDHPQWAWDKETF